METLGKVLITLLIIVLITAGVLLGVFLSQESKYMLLITGDQGQFEIFRRQYFEVKDLDISKQEKINKIFEGKTYSVSNGKCIMKTAEKEINLTDLKNSESFKEGMLNWGEMLNTRTFRNHLSDSDEFVLLGDSIYPENKKLAEVGPNKTAVLGSKDKWNERLVCTWNVFIEHLKDLKLMENNKLDEKVYMLAGNHAFDVSHDKEEQIVRGLEASHDNSLFYTYDPAKNTLNEIQKTPGTNLGNYSYVRKVTINQDKVGRKIVFVDINSAPFVCLSRANNEQEYNNPDKCGFDKYYIERWTYQRAVNYYLAIYEVVKNLNKNDWNVMRGHHAPSNFEDGDTDFYWGVNINGQFYNLMDLFEQKNLRIFFGSHYHGQAVMTIPFRKEPIRSRGDKISAQKDGSYCNVNNLNANSTELVDVVNQCTQTEFEINLNDQNLMMVFVNGNSGRVLDPVSNGLRSAKGNLVWARKNTYVMDGVTREAYGYSVAEFKKNELEVKFFEVTKVEENTLDSREVVEFEVKYDDKEKFLTQNDK